MLSLAIEFTLFLALLAPTGVWAFPPASRIERVLQLNERGPSLKRDAAAPSTTYETRFPGVTWSQNDWQITTTELDQGHYQSRMSVANGYLGLNVAALGPFFEFDTPVAGDDINGWPEFQRRQTFGTIGGFWDSQPTTNETNFDWLYQYGGDSVISGVPHWSGLILDLGNGVFLDASTNSSTISNFKSTLDMKGGIMNWAFTWAPEGGASFDIAFQMFAHKLNVTQAFVEMQITPTSDTNATIVNVLDGSCAVRTDFDSKGVDGQMIYSAVRPVGINNVTAFVYAGIDASGGVNASAGALVIDKAFISSNESSIAQAFQAALKANETTTITKYVGGASTDAFPNPQAVAKAAASAGKSTGYSNALQSHVTEWATVFPDDSIDDFTLANGSLPNDLYLLESAITAVANPYYLLQQTVSANALEAVGNAPIDENSIAVGGLGSDSYAGLIFWDAEIWMQPGLVTAFPEAARQIANYRVARYAQAKRNTQTAYQSSQGQRNRTFSDDGAIFSWTSGRFGNCTASGPCWDYEYHINGDIAMEFANYWVASGDDHYFKQSIFPVYRSIAITYSELLEKNGSRWSVLNMTDPDEYANHVNSSGYTMPLIADTLLNSNNFSALFGEQPNQTFTNQAQNVYIGRNENAGITLEYTSMNGSIDVKQADIVLNTYPLRYIENYTTTESLTDLDYYSSKQSPNGPGMTYAIFAIVANQVSPSGCASYTYQQYSEQPYARAPWFQLSEQLDDNYSTNGGTHPAYPFLTGHGGANQVVLFGYLGLRLVPDYTLHIDPALPPQITQIRYRTFYWHGWPIQATSNNTHTVLRRSSAATVLATANTTFSNTSIPVQVGSADNSTNYSLSPNGTLVIANRMPGLVASTPGNIAQCQPVSSTTDIVPGQFPMSAVDGAVSTKWVPSSANVTASLTVTLPNAIQRISAFQFDWAQSVPVNYTVELHNSTNPSGNYAVQDHNVTISNPFDPAKLADLVPYMSNTTNVSLSRPVWSAKYATFTMIGNKGYATAPFNGSAAGASLAEFVILAENGASLPLTARSAYELPPGLAPDVATDLELGKRHDEKLAAYGRYMERRSRI